MCPRCMRILSSNSLRFDMRYSLSSSASVIWRRGFGHLDIDLPVARLAQQLLGRDLDRRGRAVLHGDRHGGERGREPRRIGPRLSAQICGWRSAPAEPSGLASDVWISAAAARDRPGRELGLSARSHTRARYAVALAHRAMAKHHPDLVMCRKQPGIAIGRLCEKCDGKCVICDSYVRPCTLVRICDECNYGSYEGRCVICGGIGISDAYYCRECTQQEKDRDGCPKIVNLGSSKTDLFYERKKCVLRAPNETAKAARARFVLVHSHAFRARRRRLQER